MALTPYIKVIIQKTGKDISQNITRLSHDLSVDRDNLLTLEIKNINTDLIDDQDLKEGENLSFSYGYIGGKTGPTYLARISDILPNYGEIISVTIRATDIGFLMKKGSSKKIWQNIKSSDIVKQLALANGLNAIVDDTDTVHKSMPQGSKSDYDFIKYLASIEKNGSWRFFLRNDELHFTRIKLEAKSTKTITYKDGNGGVKSFRPYSQEMLKQAASRDTVIATVDPFTNKVVNNVVNNSTSKDDVKLGEFTYDVNAIKIGYKNGSPLNTQRPSQVQKAQDDPTKAGRHVFSPSRTINEAQNIGNKIKKKSSLSDYQATLTMEGDPDFLEDIIITMSGVAKKDAGNWYVTRVTHVIDPGTSYEHRATMNKNAGKKTIGNSQKSTNQNNTVGPVKKDNSPVTKEVTLLKFDKDAIQVK